MKKVLKWLGIIIGAVVLVIIIAGVVIMLVVDEKMIAGQMEKALNRHVSIENISAGIFSVVSGIEVNNVQISNFKTAKQLEALKDKPVAKGDLFVGLKAFKFKLQFMPLLSGKFILKEITLYEPVINVIKNKKGVFNFDDLTKPAPKTEEPAAKEEPVKEEPKEAAKEEKPEPAKPFTVDDLPISITVGKIGIEKGQLKYEDQGLGQTFQVYDLTTLVHSIKIDPKDLAKNDYVGLKVQMGVKTLGDVKTGSVKSFDMVFDINGDITPFDLKTRKADPEVKLKAGMPYGTMTGLQIFEKMKSVEALSKYCGKLDFLKKDIKWKNAFVNVWYKGGTVKLQDGKIPTDDYDLTYAGQTNINTKAVDLDMDMLLADKHKVSIEKGIGDNVKKGLAASAQLAKYVKPEKVTGIAMERLVNKDGKVNLRYKVTGKMNDPDTRLVSPSLPSMKDLLKESAGNLKDAAMDKGKELAKKAADKGKDKATKKGKEEAKKQADKLKGKLPF
ncbi:MAG: AsmA family protein [Spirochaetes bacterium]|nr:AsmA family protein [Spirochaetota bacterium]